MAMLTVDSEDRGAGRLVVLIHGLRQDAEVNTAILAFLEN
jgi:hypothetical protein